MSLGIGFGLCRWSKPAPYSPGKFGGSNPNTGAKTNNHSDYRNATSNADSKNLRRTTHPRRSATASKTKTYTNA